MQKILSIKVPEAWQSLDNDQLRFVFHLLSREYSLPQIRSLCLLKWAKIHGLYREGAVFIVKHKGKRYPLTALQVAEASEALKWLGDVAPSLSLQRISEPIGELTNISQFFGSAVNPWGEILLIKGMDNVLCPEK